MTCEPYHYTECGLDNIYLQNGYKFIETSRGKSISIHDVDGLHRAIGLFLVTCKKDFLGDEVRFLRQEMLMSQLTLAKLLGVSEQAVRRWETGKINTPAPSGALLRLLYMDHVNNKDSKISTILKKIAELEDTIDDHELVSKDTEEGWQSAA